MTPSWSTALLLGLVLFLLFAGLGSTPLTDRDEGANAEAAREMGEQRSWLTPTLNYAPRFAKPALVYWLMAGGYALFGASELAARLPSAVATTLLVLLQYVFARWALGAAGGVRAALILLLSGEVVVLGRMALTDATLLLGTTAAGYAFVRGHHGPPPRGGWYAAMYAAMALGTLAKGPVGILVPAVGIVVYLAVAGGGRRALREARLPWGAALFLLLAGPWYAAMLSQHGGLYLARAQGETLGRVFRTVTGPGGTVLFYLPVVLLGLFPWSALLPSALVRALRGARAQAAGGVGGAAAVFAATWVVTVLVLFSLFQSRLPHYVAPLFPPAALLLAGVWPERVGGGVRGLLAAFGVVVGAGAGAAVLLGPTLTRVLAAAYPADPAAGLPASVLVVGLLAVVAGAASRLTDGRRLFGALATVTSLLFLVTLHVAWPAFSARFVAPAGELAARLEPAARPCDDVVVMGPYRPSLVFYARRPLIFVGQEEHSRLAEVAARHGRLFVLTPAALVPGLPPAVAALSRLDARGGYVVLASPPGADSCP